MHVERKSGDFRYEGLRPAVRPFIPFGAGASPGLPGSGETNWNRMGRQKK